MFHAICTDRGNVKKINQDSAIYKEAETGTRSLILAAVCDGMGGLQNVGDDMTKLCTAAGAGKVFPTIPVKGVDVAQAGEKLAAWLKECGIC